MTETSPKLGTRDEFGLSTIQIFGLPGIPAVQPGDDLPDLIGNAIERSGLGLERGDVIVVTHKIVSKAEGRLVALETVEPSDFAERFARESGKDPRHVEVVLREAVRISRMEPRRGIIIAETRHGFVCANAAVDASNVTSGVVCLLPKDPDGSAAAIRRAVGERFGFAENEAPGVIISDSFGRPWRQGIVNVAIGVAGLAPLADYRGAHDPAGYELHASVLAVADELASAAELVQGKLGGRPVALIRGFEPPVELPPSSGHDLVMPAERDLYR